VIALQVALKLCLGDERIVKVRCAAKETSVHWQYFLPQHDNITEPVTPQLKWPLNKCHSRNDYTATGSCDTGIKSKLASNVKANEKEKQKEKKKESGKEQDCIAHQEENSMNWCQEYYALKADRRGKPVSGAPISIIAILTKSVLQENPKAKATVPYGLAGSRVLE